MKINVICTVYHIVYDLPGTKVTMPVESTDGTCGSRSLMGKSGLIGYVGYHNTGKQICSRYGGVFLQVDGGMPITR